MRMHEDTQTLVLAKPATLPMHPCGAYHFNSLFHGVSSARHTGRAAERAAAAVAAAAFVQPANADAAGGGAADGCA